MSDKDEALRLAGEIERVYRLGYETEDEAKIRAMNSRRDAAAMLRSQHARIAELEAVARVALKALDAISGDICTYVHHAKQDRHGYGDVCPVHERHDAAIASLRKTLGEE